MHQPILVAAPPLAAGPRNIVLRPTGAMTGNPRKLILASFTKHRLADVRQPAAGRLVLVILLAILLTSLAMPAVAGTPAGVLTARAGAVTRGADAPRGFRRLDQQGMARSGILYVPSNYDPKEPAPLVVLLHGAGGDARRAVEAVKRHAEAQGVIVLAPASQGGTWDLIAQRRYDGDARMLDALLRELFARYAVDPRRITIAGFSDGGSYALSLGLSNGDLFERIVAFSPGFVLPLRQAGRPKISIWHGTADPVLPIAATSRRIAATLRQAGYDVRLTEFDGGHGVPPAVAAAAFAQMAQPVGRVAESEPISALALAEAGAAGEDELRFEDLLWPGANRPVARWRDPVCLRVIKASSTFAQLVEAQIGAIARTAGVPIAGRPCRPNVTIELARMPPGRPVAWRYAVRPAAPHALRLVSVTVDKARAEAMPLEAVAAFMALISFAELKPPAPAPRGTLLGLFDHADAPQRLTTRDLDFLRQLYASP